ncbi:MAG: amidohydrolase family protein [Bryobacteraceae bacterium]|nr:amidohydrolase family protein [Bryobacteraceae bacterium]
MYDAHIHFFSRNFFSMLARQKGAGATAENVCAELGWPVPPEDPAVLAAEWAQELDRNEVAGAALIASLPGDEESVAKAVRAFPDRFAGFFFLNPLAPDAVDRTIRAFALGLRGVCLFPAMHGFSLAGEQAGRVIETAAAQPGAVVFVHCGLLSVGVRKKLGLASPFDLRFSNPVDLHPVALRHPNLPFIIPHFGAGYFREALMVASLCPNIYLDTSSSNDWTRCLTPKPTLEEVFERALEVVGPERLLFGTDSSFFPRGWVRPVYESQSRILDWLGVGEEAKSGVLGANLRRLGPFLSSK